MSGPDVSGPSVEVAGLADAREALRREIGPPTDRDGQWQPMVSAHEVRLLLDALDRVEALCEEAEYVVLAADDPGLPPVKAVAVIDLAAALASTPAGRVAPMSDHQAEFVGHDHAPGIWCDECPDADEKRAPRTHVVKVQPPYFDALLDGSKTFEVRKNDRAYQRGDWLVLREFGRHTEGIGCNTVCSGHRALGCEACHESDITQHESGRQVEARITFVFSGDPRFGGIEPGYVVLGLAPRTPPGGPSEVPE